MNLQRTFDALNFCYFDDALQGVKLGWMRGSKGPRKAIIFGLCFWEENTIHLNPLLNHPLIPDWYASYYMFHEMLHLVYQPRLVGGRYEMHYEEFLAAERRFVHFEEVKPWEKENLKPLFEVDSRLTAMPRPK